MVVPRVSRRSGRPSRNAASSIWIIAAPALSRSRTSSRIAKATWRQVALRGTGLLERLPHAQFGKLLQGTRRHNLVYLDDLGAAVEPEGVRLTFTLPAGSYATVLLRELTKSPELETGDEP